MTSDMHLLVKRRSFASKVCAQVQRCKKDVGLHVHLCTRVTVCIYRYEYGTTFILFLYLKNTIYEYVSKRSGGQNLQGSLSITLLF